MAHFAKIDQGKVTQVIVAKKSFFDTFVDSTPGKWLQCSFNTIEGEHINDGTPLRGNFPGVGFEYNIDLDAFIPPKRYNSWSLNETKFIYEAPIEKPEDVVSQWNEETQVWDIKEEN
jgi:hypothetical protein